MQRFVLSTTIRTRYSVESPFDSTVNYPIIRSLTNNMRPVNYKPYQDYTFALCINRLEVDDDDLHLLKTNHLLDCASLGEDSHVAPPYTNMGEATLRHIFTWTWVLINPHLALINTNSFFFLLLALIPTYGYQAMQMDTPTNIAQCKY